MIGDVGNLRLNLLKKIRVPQKPAGINDAEYLSVPTAECTPNFH
jgi:hypothetical protein